MIITIRGDNVMSVILKNRCYFGLEMHTKGSSSKDICSPLFSLINFTNTNQPTSPAYRSTVLKLWPAPWCPGRTFNTDCWGPRVFCP